MASVQRLSGGLFLLVMAALLGSVAWWTWSGAMRDGMNAAVSITRLGANQAARMIESADLLLIDMQRIARVVDWRSDSMATMAQSELDLLVAELSHVTRLSVFAPDGSLRASSDPAAEPSDTVRQEDFFAHHSAGSDGLYLSPLLRHRNGRTELMISRPVTGAGGVFDGIVTVAVDPSAFAAFFRSLDIRLNAVFHLVHDDSTILVREEGGGAEERAATAETSSASEARAVGVGRTDTREATGLPPDLGQRIQAIGGASGFHYEDGEGRQWLGAVQRVERYPLHMLIGVEHDAIVERWMAETLPYFAFGCLALMALTFLVAVSIRQGQREDQFRTALIRTNDELERRVLERTQSLANALEQKDVLFRELNHRVKNNLQIVASLLRLQAARFKDPAVTDGFTSCLGRIQSMSAVHEMLYRKDDVAHVDFRDYLQTLTIRLRDSYGARDRVKVTVDAEEDLLDVRTAVPLALFVNEVVSNCFKHAFPDGREGSIAVTWRIDGDRRELTVRDDGIGCGPDGGSRPGALGMQLARALAGQLGGTFSQQPASPGTITQLAFTLGAMADD